ncbi:MAG: hypothetical protein JWM07_7 [Candidatus Saccharibacteria bacterium]|nr:hypothetical protein [Candidatus Saccharibacteria bacterium]
MSMYSDRQSNYNESEPKLASPALDRFGRDLNTLSHGISLDMAFQKYIRDELEISEVEADLMHLHMQKMGIIPEASDYDECQVELKDALRLTIFTEVHPLYALKHSTDDYDRWIPQAFSTMLANNERHDLDICFRTNGRVATECECGPCPFRTIEDAAKQAHMNPDFNSFEYLIDSDKMHRRAEILLTHAVNYEIIPKTDVYTLESNYKRHCKEYFGGKGE